MGDQGLELEEIEEEVKKETPSSINITKVEYEGPELVIYTSDPRKFLGDGEIVHDLARQLRKRIKIRPDPNSLLDEGKAKDKIEKIVPEEAGIQEYDFNKNLGEVIIKAEKPRLVIGRGGETLREIAKEIGWTADVFRAPPVSSKTVKQIRSFLEEEREERREFLREEGKKIHREKRNDEQWVRTTMLGCCQEVGRAAFLLSTPETRILIDCGDKPGSGEVPYLQVPEVVPLDSIDAVVLTHAHLDHSAFIPLLYKYGYEGPVYATEPTRDLAALLQLDYIDIAVKEGEKPYQSEFVREAIKHTIPLDYGDVTDISPDIKLTFHNAGHILGSAVAHFHIGEGLHNVAFSGDIHYTETRLLDGASNDFPRLETLFLESTYGGKNDNQPERSKAEKELVDIVNKTNDKGGVTLIPTFSVGRSQEIMVVLEEAVRKNKIPEMPVYLDGMIEEATAIHTAYPEFLNEKLNERIFNDKSPFTADFFKNVENGERDQIDNGIVLATNGMMEGGPVIEHLKNLGPVSSNSLAFVGYQAPHTLGRRIQSGRDEVRVTGESVKINMDVYRVEGFSGHGDRQELLDFVEEMNPHPNKIFTIHGDESNTKDLASSLHKRLRIRTIPPQNLETYRFV